MYFVDCSGNLSSKIYLDVMFFCIVSKYCSIHNLSIKMYISYIISAKFLLIIIWNLHLGIFCRIKVLWHNVLVHSTHWVWLFGSSYQTYETVTTTNNTERITGVSESTGTHWVWMFLDLRTKPMKQLPQQITQRTLLMFLKV